MTKVRGLAPAKEVTISDEERAMRRKIAKQRVQKQTKTVYELVNQLQGALLNLNEARAECGMPAVTISDVTDTFPSQELLQVYHGMVANEQKDIRLQPPYEEQ